MKIKLWGTRGSIPTPSTPDFQTSRFGGDTTCVSIESGDLLLIMDGGSGLRLLGLELLQRKVPIRASFFFSHVHWDHIQGFPFFVPAFMQDNRFKLYGPTQGKDNLLERALRNQQENQNFPVRLEEMPSEMEFEAVSDSEEVLIKGKENELLVRAFPMNHPGGCFGYRVEEWKQGRCRHVFAFATDTEQLEDLNPQMQKLAHKADLVLHDAQYTCEEYEGREGHVSHRHWGHSTWKGAVKECRAAGARHLLLHHHDPMHDDNAVLKIQKTAQAYVETMNLGVEAARQYQEFSLE